MLEGNDLTKSLLIGLIEHFEGLYLKPYLCSAGVATIGFGTTVYPNKVRVTLKDPPCTKDQAYSWAWHELKSCMENALKFSPCLADHPTKLAAISSFIYNLGAGAYRSSTLRKKINEENWDEAKIQILRWNKAGGKVLRGLTRRREAEAALL